MDMIDLDRDGDIHVITLNNGPNMIEPSWQTRMLEVLDSVESHSEGNAALVLTGVGKFFSNGLNVEVVMGLKGQDMAKFGTNMTWIMRRLTMLPIPTVAAINGHAFAAGAFLALACDYRLIREDRGWICVSEVDVGVPISAPMMNLLKAKLPANTARDAVLSGKRYAADEAIACGFADGKASEANLGREAKKLASSLASKERRIFRSLKQQLNADVDAGFTEK